MMQLLCLLALVGSAVSVPLHSSLPSSAAKCGYDSCTDAKPDMLNVHIVAHTHDDVGWLKTVDQYYFGIKNYIQKAGVQYILDSVVQELLEDKKRKFIYVETAFFWKWWVRQKFEKQDQVRMLVREGRLQFVGGAWSMNDEAAAHYHSIVDQFTHGLRKLNSTFGPCAVPTIGWQIDPFGHSREFASLLAAMGYDGLFLGRIDYQDKMARGKGGAMEMLWRGDDDLGNSSDIFTSVLYNQYQPPPGFCFDVLCADEPIVDDPDSPEFNVDDRVAKFLTWVKEQRKYYITKNVLVTMGGDFTYQDAGIWYRNLDKLIQYTNLMAAKDGLDINVFYSTPTCYLKAVRDAKPTLPIKQDDFFPYASDPTAYWTGYFTSRPTTKYFERRGNTQLQMIKQLQVLADMERHYEFIIDELRATMGVMQHHDAITGTEKQHVTHDYVRMLNQAVDDALILHNQAYNKIAQGDVTKVPVLSFKRCALNESRCEVIQSAERFAINIYNPLPWARTHVLRVPVVDERLYDVRDPEGKLVQSVTQEMFKGFVEKYRTPAKYEIVFPAKLEPLGFVTYYVTQQKRRKRNTKNKSKNEYYENITDYWKNIRERSDIQPNMQEVIANIPDMPTWNVHDMVFVNSPKVNLDILKDKKADVVVGLEQLDALNIGRSRAKESERNRDIDKMSMLNEEEMRMLSDDPSATMIVERFDEEGDNPQNKVQTSVDILGSITHSQDRYTIQHGAKFYPACAGNNQEYKNRSSGAYILRPNATKPTDLKLLEYTNVQNFIGKEYYNILSHNVSYVLRINDAKYLPYNEIEWSVGPISVDDWIGKEFIMTHSINVKNGGEFYTDSNGRQMIKRIKNKRPQWNVTLTEPIPGNYYPINNEISLQNEDVEFIVLTDRSCGGTSMNEGEIEIMVHRRLLADDAFGVSEALNEMENGSGIVVRGTHKFLLAPTKYDNVDEAVVVRRVEIEAQCEPVVLFADATKLKYQDWVKMRNRFSGLDNLDKAVNILTLEPWEGDSLLLRLENVLSKETGLKEEELNRSVDLSKLFKHIRVVSAKETLLAANQWIEQHEHWEWKKNQEFSRSFNEEFGSNEHVPRAENVNRIRDNGLVINLGPKQIRTFVVQYEFMEF